MHRSRRSLRVAAACSSLVAMLVHGCGHREIRPLVPCTLIGVSATVRIEAIDHIDLLFVIDDSNSMADEQVALAAEFPAMITSLLSADVDRDGVPDVRTLRVGIVTTDMGVNGLGVTSGPRLSTCGRSADGTTFIAEEAWRGDDGVLATTAHPNGPDGVPGNDDDAVCEPAAFSQTAATIPAFLTFEAGPAAPDPAQVAAFAERIRCFASVGTGGCGFEQQLEAALKAATPAESTTRFFASPDGTDRGHAGSGVNGEWFRDDALLAIVLLTDEDDCSAKDARVFDYTSCDYPDPENLQCTDPSAEPYPGTQANTRCNRHPELLHEVERYVDGIASLRANPENVVFAAITGIPNDLVDEPGEGTSGFDAILADPRMNDLAFYNLGRDRVHACSYGVDLDEDGTIELGFTDLNGDGLWQRFGCSVDLDDDGQCDPDERELACEDVNGNGACEIGEPAIPNERQTALPARRIVETARGLAERGVNVVLQSICQQSFEGAMQAILGVIEGALHAGCLRLSYTRTAADRVPCTVVERLASPGQHCRDLVHLGRDPEPERIEDGVELCTIRQIAVPEAIRALGQPLDGSLGEGWYYDDFTAERLALCGAQRIAFTEAAQPASGHEVRIECLKPVDGGDLAVDVDTPCAATPDGHCGMSEPAYDAFRLRYDLAADYAHSPVFCEPQTNTCQIACATNADCPGGTVCHAWAGQVAHCVNPICQPFTP